ncbi:MAG TPA: valine--tRNA ligase [Candidatus Krumholzibacteria bacterium]|nr:valine--tRNA ligase [Candidatus Krumholzibacteria bacterium]HPD72808.1 valine--tRNA ligase [Candidatus Krumholzibacteria bacterium]HRY40260.1 valine--tRNA ligase [Candidatus Krumholzibacteria bacterium]
MNDVRQLAQYSPQGLEEKWYARWEAEGLFAPRTGAGAPFVITLPPPNVTGILHMGHCLGNSIQDTLIRYYRMLGRETLWVPGTDHASIATEQVVSRQLRDEGIDKRAAGRAVFLERAWAWKEQTHGRITKQLRRLGCSLDWSREAFTMDDARNRAVVRCFVDLYAKGLVFRDLYLVNWCPHCLTAISDDEVEYQEHQGSMWHIRYPFADGGGDLTVATTRPETMFGDTAVAVNPDDPERRHLIGRRVRLPLTDRTIPIVGDPHADPEKGTGFVKITPAHDPNDFLVGKRHDLPQVVCMDPRGVMNEHAGEFAGLDRAEARRRVVAALSGQGLLAKVDPHVHQVGHHDRCGTVIEPYLSKQWFLRMEELAGPAIQAVESGAVTLLPDRWVGVYHNWLGNIRDWCISRQLWWGHRLPVWYCQDCSAEIVALEPPARCQCGSARLEQDPDVLDTWFSSWLWTFSPLGWPERTADLARYHPTSVLVTAADIIFFWVARMIMASYEFLGEPPFREVLFTGIVRDAEGRKMSKSLGNSPDPIDLIDTYGADALRCSLVMLTPTGADIFFSEASLEVGRNFCNKIFQATKLVLGVWDESGLAAPRAGVAPPPGPIELVADRPWETAPAAAFAAVWRATFGAEPPLVLRDADLQLEDRWILGRLCATARECNEHYARRRLNDAAYGAFNFFRHELCDWYLEAIKPRLRDERLRGPALSVAILELALSYKLLHPVMPFITEELWSWLPPASGRLMVSGYPDATGAPPFAGAQAAFGEVMTITGVLRNLRSELGVAPGRRGRAVLRVPSSERVAPLGAVTDLIALLVKLESVTVECGGDVPRPAGVGIAGDVEVFLPMAGLVDLDKERERLGKELAKLSGWIAGCRAKLANANFVANAPADVVQKQKDLLAENEAKVATLQERLRGLGN